MATTTRKSFFKGLSDFVDFGALRQQVPHSQGFVATTLPRGGLQLLQPRAVPEGILKPYTRGAFAYDVLSWQAMRTGKPLRGEEADQQALFEKYQAEVLAPAGMAFAAAAPFADPALDGFPGAIQIFRTPEAGRFTNADLKRLHDYAKQAADALAESRRVQVDSEDRLKLLKHDVPVKQFVIDGKLNCVFPGTGLQTLDERLRTNLLDYCRQQFHRYDGQQASAARVAVAGEKGEFWTFRGAIFEEYPALGTKGPFMFFSLQPPCGDWSMLRPEDFHADEEVGRLIPALTFMAEHYQRGPTLNEIAAVVGLSPFHFHRRFTELLGITPKHFMFDCQVIEAKKRLVERELDLVEVASTCGFAHQSHFTSRFKQATGLTPTRWRRLAMQEQREMRTQREPVKV